MLVLSEYFLRITFKLREISKNYYIQYIFNLFQIDCTNCCLPTTQDLMVSEWSTSVIITETQNLLRGRHDYSNHPQYTGVRLR